MRCGYAYLADTFNVRALSLTAAAQVSTGVNKLIRTPDKILVPPRMVPDANDLAAHLTFAVKHEGINLEILSQVLPRIDASVLQTALDATPSSAVLRKLGWLWEEFSAAQLRYDQPSGNYVPVFDEATYFTGPKRQIPRWRIIFNGLGPLSYCPVVRKTEALSQEVIGSLFQRLHEELSSIDQHLLQRAAEWAYLSETRSSFEIEKEPASGSKAQRFIALLKNANAFEKIDENTLCDIQNRIVASAYSQAMSYRTEQNWLANTGVSGMRRITYVPPSPDVLDELMASLLEIINTPANAIHPLVAAAVVSFSFVYLHPFLDGNGRLSRFLIHQQLNRSDLMPKGCILPVSAAMLEHEHEYLQALEHFSGPCRELWDVTQIDEADCEFQFNGSYAAYRYWDATAQCEFLLQMMQQAVNVYLLEELSFLEKYDHIYRSLNEQFDVVQKDLDVIVASAISLGRVSANLRKKFLYKVQDELFDELQKLLDQFDSSGSLSD